MIKKWIKMILLGLTTLFFLNSCLLVTIWDSIKDRYKPYEFLGAEGDKVLVKFTFDSPSSTEVWLAGGFNGWAASASAQKYPDVPLDSGVLIPCQKDDKGYWTVTIPLASGRYPYKYVLDAGRVWQYDINTDTIDDGFGGKNSIIVVISK